MNFSYFSLPGFEPDYYTSGINVVTCNVTNPQLSSACPTKVVAGIGAIDYLKDQVSDMNVDIKGLFAQIDGGDIDALIDAINDSGNSSSTIKSLLLSNSPLSDLVLLEMLDRYPQMSNDDILDVLIENSRLTNEVLDEVDNLNTPFSSGQLSELEEAQDEPSARELIHEEIASICLRKTNAFNKIILLYADTLALDSVVDYLTNEGSYQAQLALVPILLEIDPAACQEFIEGIDAESVDDSKWLGFYQLAAEVALNTRGCLDMTENQRNSYEIFNSEDYDCHILAKTMLSFLDETEVEYEPMVAEDEEYKTNEVKGHSAISESSSTSSIKSCYPVPFMNQVSFKFFIADDAAESELRILDIVTGRTVYSAAIAGYGYQTLELSTFDMNKGVFTGVLVINGKVADSVKLVKL